MARIEIEEARRLQRPAEAVRPGKDMARSGGGRTSSALHVLLVAVVKQAFPSGI